MRNECVWNSRSQNYIATSGRTIDSIIFLHSLWSDGASRRKSVPAQRARQEATPFVRLSNKKRTFPLPYFTLYDACNTINRASNIAVPIETSRFLPSQRFYSRAEPLINLATKQFHKSSEKCPLGTLRNSIRPFSFYNGVTFCVMFILKVGDDCSTSNT